MASKVKGIEEDDPQPTGSRVHDAWGIQSDGGVFGSGGSGWIYCDGLCNGKLVPETDCVITQHPLLGVQHFCFECAEKLNKVDIDGVYNKARVKLRKERIGDLKLFNAELKLKLTQYRARQAEHRLLIAKHNQLVRWMMQEGIGL